MVFPISPATVPYMLCIVVLTAAKTQPKVHDLYGETGTSVIIPGVNLSNKTYHELKRMNGNPDWVVQYHAGTLLHVKYENRGFLFPNGSFKLENVTKADSGTYVHLVNHEIRITTKITVIDPVEQPVLQMEYVGGETCQLGLHCIGSGGGVAFFKNGVKINENIMEKGNVLLVQQRQHQSSGSYTCELRNEVSQKTSSAVQFQPQAFTFHCFCVCVTIGTLLMLWMILLCRVFACYENMGKKQENEDSLSRVSTENQNGDVISEAIVPTDLYLGIFSMCGAFFSSVYVYEQTNPWMLLFSALFIISLIVKIIYWISSAWARCPKIGDYILQITEFVAAGICIFALYLFLYKDICMKILFKQGWIWISSLVPVFITIALYLISFFYLKAKSRENVSSDEVRFRNLPSEDDPAKCDMNETVDNDLTACKDDNGLDKECVGFSKENTYSKDKEVSEEMKPCSEETPFCKTESPQEITNTGQSIGIDGGQDGTFHAGDFREVGQRSAGDSVANG
ncbi:uncharacterized protein LOC134615280 isoform X1 [Pelobates fuscus]|uniref:uncharacterized protein LOC134615280 isoform X1 n=1 Tax=Pelobates fuscus TaxID=191477 RepID=UPI002FE48255